MHPEVDVVGDRQHKCQAEHRGPFAVGTQAVPPAGAVGIHSEVNWAGTRAAKTFLHPRAAITPTTVAMSHGQARAAIGTGGTPQGGQREYGIATPSESVRLVQISLRYGFQNASPRQTRQPSDGCAILATMLATPRRR